MPLFEYRCRKCNVQFEAYKRPSEDPSHDKCPACGAKAPKVAISLVGPSGGGLPATGGSGGCGGSGRMPFG